MGSALPAYALTNTSELTVNWDNYRYCAADDAKPLATCAEADVRSPSRYYIPDGTQGTLDISSSGVVKLRMDTISVDTTGTSCSYDHTVNFGQCVYTGPLNPHTVDCNANPARIGHCAGSASDSCCMDSQCNLPACDGGPHSEERCPTLSTCTNTAGATFTVKMHGVQNGLEVIPGFFPWQYYKLLGDSSGVGCTKACTFTLGSGNPQYNNNDLSSTCSTSGDCSGDPNFYSMEITDPDGEVFAIPTRGTAKLQTNVYVVNGDPAKEGDYCRTQDPPPANCP
jgi:hypothetical protein